MNIINKKFIVRTLPGVIYGSISSLISATNEEEAKKIFIEKESISSLWVEKYVQVFDINDLNDYFLISCYVE